MKFYWLDIFLEPRKTIRDILDNPDQFYGFFILMLCFGLNMVSTVLTFDPTSLPTELPFSWSKLVLIALIGAFPLALLVQGQCCLQFGGIDWASLHAAIGAMQSDEGASDANGTDLSLVGRVSVA